MTRWPNVLLCVAVAGCAWVSDSDIENLEDWDDDGFADVLYAGTDCDDEDPEVHPGAPDPPDDGVDTDCGGTDGPDVLDTGLIP